MKLPAVNVNATALLALVGVVIVGVAGVWAWRRFNLGVKLNPASADNFVYSGATDVLTDALGREESPGTAAYEAVHGNPIARAWRWATGPSVDDIDYSGPVTPTEKQLVKNNHITP